jgi:hypothetical protein
VTSSQLIDPPSGDVGSWTPTQIAAQVANNENTKASLLLSPHTRLTLSGAADVFFSTTGRLSSSGDQHSLQASFLVLLSAAPGGKQQLEAASQDMWIPVEPSPDSSSYHEDLALSITNDSDEATSVGFWFRVASYAAAPHYALPQPPIPAIPEPAAGPLMLLGVGAVLKLARRR